MEAVFRGEEIRSMNVELLFEKINFIRIDIVSTLSAIKMEIHLSMIQITC